MTVVRNGFVRIAPDKSALERFRLSVERQRELGVTDARVLDPDELPRLIPEIEVADIAGAIYGPSDGYVDGHLLCTAYADKARALGVRIAQRAALVECRAADDGSMRLVTTAGDVHCDVVVNAAGAWASKVREILGAPVPSVPHRQQVARRSTLLEPVSDAVDLMTGRSSSRPP